MDLHVDTRAFERAVAEFALAARIELDEALRRQAGILVGLVLKSTPPADYSMDPEKSVASAKKAGETNVRNDIQKLFIPTRVPEERMRQWVVAGKKPKWLEGAPPRWYVTDTAGMEDWHLQSRSRKTGRTTGGKWGGSGHGRANMNVAWAPAPVLRAYVRQMQQRVGLLMSGWLQAAVELGTASRHMPAWVRRHGASGPRPLVRKSADGTTITVPNMMRHQAPDMRGRIQRAVRTGERKMLVAVKAILDRRAKAASK